jgi:hypothetical protein
MGPVKVAAVRAAAGRARVARQQFDPAGRYHRPDIFRLYVDTSSRHAVIETGAAPITDEP